MLFYVHSSPIYNCQMLERTQVSLNGRVDAKYVVYLHNGVDCFYSNSAIRNNEFMKFLDKRMELENIILSEVTQSQKINRGMHSLVSGY